MEEAPGKNEISEPAMKRELADIMLAQQEKDNDFVIARLAMHAREVMHHGDTRICFIDAYHLAGRIAQDSTLNSLKIHYWFLEHDSPRLSHDEERAAYEEDRELIEELTGEPLSFEEYLAFSQSLPKTSTLHFALVARDESRGFFIDTVGHMSACIFPGLHELELTEGPAAVTRVSVFRQMVSRPISTRDIPDPITVTDRVLFTRLQDLPEA